MRPHYNTSGNLLPPCLPKFVRHIIIPVPSSSAFKHLPYCCCVRSSRRYLLNLKPWCVVRHYCSVCLGCFVRSSLLRDYDTTLLLVLSSLSFCRPEAFIVFSPREPSFGSFPVSYSTVPSSPCVVFMNNSTHTRYYHAVTTVPKLLLRGDGDADSNSNLLL